MLVDIERGIVDPVVVILGAFEDDGAGLEGAFLARRGQDRAWKSGEITLVFISALSKRLPESTLKPALMRMGAS